MQRTTCTSLSEKSNAPGTRNPAQPGAAQHPRTSRSARQIDPAYRDRSIPSKIPRPRCAPNIGCITSNTVPENTNVTQLPTGPIHTERLPYLYKIVDRSCPVDHHLQGGCLYTSNGNDLVVSQFLYLLLVHHGVDLRRVHPDEPDGTSVRKIGLDGEECLETTSLPPSVQEQMRTGHRTRWLAGGFET